MAMAARHCRASHETAPAGERGQALIAAVVLTAVMAMLVAGLATSATLRLSRARLYADRLSARQAAGAAADLALARLGQLWRDWATAGTPALQLRDLQPPLAAQAIPGSGGGAQQVVADVYAPGAAGADPYSYTVLAAAHPAGGRGGHAARALADTPFRFLLFAQGDIALVESGVQLVAVDLQGHVRAGGAIAASYNGLPMAFPAPAGTDVHGRQHQAVSGAASPRLPLPEAGPHYEALAATLDAAPSTLHVDCQATPTACTGAVTVSQDTHFHNGSVNAASLTVAPGVSVVIDGDLSITGAAAVPQDATVYVRGNAAIKGSNDTLDLRGVLAVGGRTEITATQTCVLFVLSNCVQWDTLNPKVRTARIHAVSTGPGDADNSIHVSGATLELLGTTAVQMHLYTEPCRSGGCTADIDFQNPDLSALSANQCRCSFVSGGNITISFTGIALAQAVTFAYDPGMWLALPGGLDPARAFRILRWKGDWQ